MRLKKHNAEQIVTLLLQVEVEIADGMTTLQACNETGETGQYGAGPHSPTQAIAL